MLRNLLINAGEIPLLIDHHRMYIDTLLQVHWEPLFISNNQHAPRFLPTTRSYAERVLEWKRYDDDWVSSVE